MGGRFKVHFGGSFGGLLCGLFGRGGGTFNDNGSVVAVSIGTYTGLSNIVPHDLDLRLLTGVRSLKTLSFGLERREFEALVFTYSPFLSSISIGCVLSAFLAECRG